MITIIATDLDNTLFQIGKDVPPPDFFEKILKWQKNKGSWVIATGRSSEQTKGFIDEWPVEPDYFIARERYIFQAEGDNFTPWENWNQSLQKKSGKIEKEREKWLTPIIDWLEASSFKAELSDGYLHFESETGARRGEKKLMDILPDDRKPIRNRIYLGVVPEETGKGRCLNHLAKKKGWNPGEIICVGDSANDLDMLDGRYAFNSAAVANAEDRIKEAVAGNDGILLESPVGRGVLELLDRL